MAFNKSVLLKNVRDQFFSAMPAFFSPQSSSRTWSHAGRFAILLHGWTSPPPAMLLNAIDAAGTPGSRGWDHCGGPPRHATHISRQLANALSKSLYRHQVSPCFSVCTKGEN